MTEDVVAPLIAGDDGHLLPSPPRGLERAPQGLGQEEQQANAPIAVPERVRKVSDVLKEGDEVMVKVLEIDRQGKIRLSRKEALEETGASVGSSSPA